MFIDMKKIALIFALLCLSQANTLLAAQAEGDGTRVDNRTERHIERRAEAANSTPAQRAENRTERREKAEQYRQNSEGASKRKARRESRRALRQETRAAQ